MRSVQESLRAAQTAREKWEKVRASLEPLVTQALSARNVADVDGLHTRWTLATDLAAENGWDRALASVPGIIGILRTPAAAA